MTNWKVVTATHLAAAAAGFLVAPWEMLDTEVKQSGVFTADTMHILSATVLSLRAEAKLLCFTYRGETHVMVGQSQFWILYGTQDLALPASVGYYVDLSELTLDRVTYDDRAKLVTVSLPPLRLGDVAFEPEKATFRNGGILTYSQATVDELSRLNYGSARKAFVHQAQGETLVDAAQRQAKLAVQEAFTVPLRVVGKPDVRVVAVFDPPR